MSAGSGITPIMSMLRSDRARGKAPKTWCTCTVRETAEEVIFGEELRELAAASPDIA